MFPVHASASTPTKSYGSSGDSKFIPQIWSSKLVQKFYDTTVFQQIANTDYEGEISAHGDSVVIRTVPSVTIRDYQKADPAGLQYEDLAEDAIQLDIDKGKYFAFNLYDVDKYQSDLNLMNIWAEDASEQMKIAIDGDILEQVPSGAHAQNSGLTAGRISQNINMGVSGTPIDVSKDGVAGDVSVTDWLVNMGTIADEQNLPDSNRWVVLPAAACGMIKKSDLKDASLSGDAKSTLRSGVVGMIDRWKIILSNNIFKPAAGEYDIIFGHKSALTFASQITEMQEIDNPSDFGKLVRSLKVFGWKVVKPESMGHSVARFVSA